MTGHDLARDQTPITAILEKQRSAFLREGAPGLAQRQADLIKLKNALLARRRTFEVAAHADRAGSGNLDTNDKWIFCLNSA